MTDNPQPENAVALPPKATLDDLGVATVNLVITLIDDSQVTLGLKMLPQYRMMELVAHVHNPNPPLVDYGPGGKPVFNNDDPAYLAACEQAAFKRNSILIAEMIQMEIPGGTLDERAEYIRTRFDALVTEQIVLVLKLQREKAKARIISRAGTFHLN